MTDPYSSITFESSLLVPNNGTPKEFTVMKYNIQRQEFVTSYTANASNFDVTYLCEPCSERIRQDSETVKACFVCQVSERTHPSELVLGITSTFKSCAREEHHLQLRPTQQPVEASTEETDGAMEVGRSFRTDCKLFSCQLAEPLPTPSNEHILLYSYN